MHWDSFILYAPGKAKWKMVCGYFGNDTSQDFSTFHNQLLEPLDASLPTSFEKVPQDAISKVIPKFETDFDFYALAGLHGIDKCPKSAERKLQAAMIIPLAAVCSLAGASSQRPMKFEYCVEPHVSSYYTAEQSRSLEHQFSDATIVQVMTDRKIVTLIELKYRLFPQIRSGHFAQLIHAAALAFKSGMWNRRLLCCLASLSHWHLFILEVCLLPSPHLVIKKYHIQVCGPIDYGDLPVGDLTRFYGHLVLGMAGLILSDVV